MPFKIRLLILSLALLLYSSNRENFMDYDQNTIAFDVHKDKIQISGALYPNLYQDLQASDSNKNNPLYDIISDFFFAVSKDDPLFDCSKLRAHIRIDGDVPGKVFKEIYDAVENNSLFGLISIVLDNNFQKQTIIKPANIECPDLHVIYQVLPIPIGFPDRPTKSHQTNIYIDYNNEQKSYSITYRTKSLLKRIPKAKKSKQKDEAPIKEKQIFVAAQDLQDQLQQDYLDRLTDTEYTVIVGFQNNGLVLEPLKAAQSALERGFKVRFSFEY
ncbi:MAG: hypothetical protein IIT53_10445 [Fibrobacter sp.]|nr:hypothetical protein [Fibrobacter sp.]